MILIGITGKAGSGKDTAADYLVRTHSFCKMSCAGPLKNALTMMGLHEPKNREDKEKLIEGFPFTWREAAQKLGTEFGRALDPDIWVKMLRREIQGTEVRAIDCGGTVRIVISDIRFDNEAAMIRELGGVIVHLGGRAVDLGANAGHASEKGITFHDSDWMVDNGVEGVENLYSSMETILADCLGKS